VEKKKEKKRCRKVEVETKKQRECESGGGESGEQWHPLSSAEHTYCRRIQIRECESVRSTLTLSDLSRNEHTQSTGP